MNQLKIATVWLNNCYGCHMSVWDLDSWLLDLSPQIDLVHSHFADIKKYPEGVDIALVEGAVTNDDNLNLIKKIRDRSKVLISFGDCIERMQRVRDIVEVDLCLPGCPPNDNHVRAALELLLMGEIPHLLDKQIKFN